MISLFQLNKSTISGGGTIFDQAYAKSLLKAEPYIGSFWHVVFIFLCSVFIFYQISLILKQYKIREKTLYYFLFFYHMAIGSVFFYLSKNDLMLADARSYYYKVLAPDVVVAFAVKFEPSTNFIVWLTDICVYKLHLNYLCTSYLFACIGFMGLMYFMKICYFLKADKTLKYFGIYIFPFLLFLPNIHFWTTLLGKDSLIFYAIMAFTFSLTNIKKHWILFLFSGFLFFMARPHVFIYAAAAMYLALVFFARIPFVLKILLITISTYLGFILIDFFIKKKLGAANFDIKFVMSLMDSQQGLYTEKIESGSGIDLQDSSLPVKMFAYLYRPLFESLRINFIFVSIENLIFLILSFPLFTRKFYKYFFSAPFVVKFCYIYALIGVGFMGYINSNLGISTRQKTMFIFCLIIPVIGYLASKKSMTQIKIVEKNHA